MNLALSEVKGSSRFIFERGVVMESANAVPLQHLPLPYVPDLPADFVRMLQSPSNQTRAIPLRDPSPIGEV
jgi:hypothetical protein